MSQHDLNWGEVRTGESQELTPFLKLQNGENTIRVVGKPSLIDIHWEKGLDGQPKKVICPGKGCPVCKVGHAPQARYQVQVIDKTDSTVKILEGGVTIFNQIREFALNEDFGDPTQYDIKIKKQGTGRETKYTLIPRAKKIPLTDAELELVAGAKKLSEVNKTKTIEEIMLMSLEVLADSIADLDSDFGDTTPAAAKSAGKPAATANLADDDDSDWDSI